MHYISAYACLHTYWDNVLCIRQWSRGPGLNLRFYHTKDSKMVLDASLLNTQHYKVRIKDKVELSEERSNAPTTLRCCSYWKGTLRVAPDYDHQLLSLSLSLCIYIYIYIYIYIFTQPSNQYVISLPCYLALRKYSWIHTCLKGISVIKNANRSVQDLNSCRRVHFLQR